MSKSFRPLCAVSVAAVAACGSATAPVDHLTGQSADRLMRAAQSWLRTAQYHFHDTIDQSTTAANLAGVSDDFVRHAIGSISLSADGEVDGSKHISTEAFVAGIAQPIHLVEYGCAGYASADGSSWFKGGETRWLTRIVAPDFDDGLTALTWRDLGPTTRGTIAVHHLQGSMTPLGLSGAAPSPGETPPPGLSVQPTPIDLWVRSSDGSLLEMDVLIDGTLDLHAFDQGGAPQFRGATGTLTQHLHETMSFSRQRASVSAPAATLATDPVPASVYSGFGGFGVQRDDCPRTG